MITPLQLRMARAALALTTRELGTMVGVSAMAISRYERGDTGVMAVATIEKLTHYCHEQGVFFGPKDGVCYGENVFASERWLGVACYELLLEHHITPTSRDLLDAWHRAQQRAPEEPL
jgi:transcriptional regulator with XRE-family HTH domain